MLSAVQNQCSDHNNKKEDEVKFHLQLFANLIFVLVVKYDPHFPVRKFFKESSRKIHTSVREKLIGALVIFCLVRSAMKTFPEIDNADYGFGNSLLRTKLITIF